MTQLHLQHLSTTKTFSGSYEVSVMINNKNIYNYNVTNKRDVNTFNFMLNKNFKGKALNVLKKYPFTKER